MTQFRVFLSAVSSEFESARDALANDLQSFDDVTVKVQRSFRHDRTAGTLLHKLRNYIEHCDAVICLVGSRSGAGFPTAVEAAPFLADLPSGVTEASYTQWEFFFARHFGRQTHVYFAKDMFRRSRRNPAAGDRPDLQAAFLAHIESLGLQRTLVGDRHQFRAEALKDLRHEPLPRALATAIDAKLSAEAAKPIVLPYPSIGTLFKGRDDFMDRLRACLTRKDGGAAAIRAVAGMGGVGKSRAAVEYAWAHRDDYSALLWLEAETGDKLQSSLAALVGPLRLPEQAATEQAVRVEAALGWLNANPGWFLILDNVDTPPALDAAHRLMGRIGGGHVVLTSRLGGFPEGIEVLDLDVLTLPAAAALLLEASAPGRRAAPDDDAQAQALAQELGQLALALTIAAATIRMKRLTLAQYREIWRGNRARVVGWVGQAITGYHHAVAETWQGSVDLLTPEARLLLERLAFLAPEPVPGFLLDVPVPGAEAEDLMAALDDLAAYSLATREADGASFSVHRLLQDVTRRGLEQAGTVQQRLTEALEWVNAAFTGNPQDVRTWGRLDPLAPHAEAVAARGDTTGIAEPTASLMDRLATLLQTKGSYSQAAPVFHRAVVIAENHYGRNDAGVAVYLNNLALLLHETNRAREAEPLMRRSLAIAEASRGKDHPDVARPLNNLALLMRYTNRLGEAEPLYRRALAIDEATFGNDHPNVARDLNNLAQLLQAINRLDEAESLMRRALAIDETSLGEDHPDVALDLNNLAQLLRSTNRPGAAEPLMRRALAITEASLGKDHPNVAMALNNLATLLHATNRLGEAEPLMRRAVAIDEASRGKDHPRVAITLHNLALLLQATGRVGEAEPLVRRGIDIFEASFGKDNPNVATALNNLAELLRTTNRLGEAEPLYRRALAIDEASLGKGHPDVARDLNNLALLLQATNRLGEAEPLMRRALAIFLAFQRDTGHAHPHRDAMAANYRALLAAMGKSEAEIDAELAALWREAGLEPG